MILVYLIIYLLVSVGIVIATLRYQAGYLHYPFWAALIFCGFAMPQFISLVNNQLYPGHSLEKYIIMSTLCLAATYFGFNKGLRAITGLRLKSFFSHNMNFNRLRWLSLLYILIGGFFLVRLYLSGAQFASQAWAGPWVIYLFFSGFMVYGFVIAADMYLQTGCKIDIALMLLGGMYLLLRIIIHGRRSSAFILFVIILGLLWFRKRKKIPVLLIFITVVVSFVISVNTHAYREAIADKQEFSKLLDIDLIGTFIESYGESNSSEVLNGCYIIETVDRTLTFDFGAYNWNAVIWTFVPRQVVGEEFKQSLEIPFDIEKNIYSVFGHVKHTGSTLTGIADCFLAFYYAGFIKFFVIAFILGVLYANAERGSTIAIILYLFLLPKGIFSFTHGTAQFTNELIMIGVFLLPCMVFSFVTSSSIVPAVSNNRKRIFI